LPSAILRTPTSAETIYGMAWLQPSGDVASSRDASAPALFGRARDHGLRPAIIGEGRPYSYRDLLLASEAVAGRLLAGRPDLEEERVAFLVAPGFEYVAVQWGIWRAGGIAVPLAVSHPPPELAYVIEDADAAVVMVAGEFAQRVPAEVFGAGRRRVLILDPLEPFEPPVDLGLPRLGPERRALILYTSGTTSRPKGVVTTHGGLEAQIRTLVEAWEWCADDHILCVLPLHHVHGIVNVLQCALWSGACCTMHPGFDAGTTWDAIGGGRLTLFMAVPTIYSRLIAAWRQSAPERRAELSASCQQLRLMVSGSAALPVSVLEEWREISGHTLLERYGMTEIGMALSNPLHGERRPGTVGVPLPGVRVRLVDESGDVVAEGIPGEIEVRGPGVFREYWRRPEATQAAFRAGWFRTGDVAVVEDGYYRILGRSSVDIIKTGGYKVSALEIEEVLRTHPAVKECAVVGLPDPEWGERVGVALVAAGPPVEETTLRAWARERLAPYKVPTRVAWVDDLPRNAMGKVTKPAVRELLG
jgi:malonyl-CoA/methylmalonyl-CoA synthetase